MNYQPWAGRELLLAVVLGVSAVSSASVNAQKIYRYMDENGNTIYAQQLPHGVTGKEVRPKFRSVSTKEATVQLKELSRRANPERRAPDYAAQRAEQIERVAEAEKQNCERAQKNLEILNTSARVRVADSGGNLVYLDDEGRTAKVSETRQNIQTFCK